MKLLRTLKDIRNDPRVVDVYHEAENGWWVDMHPGWCWCPETHLIHEQTIKEVCAVLNHDVTPCDCIQCQEFPMRRDGELKRAVDNYDAMRRADKEAE
jgi:hypothetical protein